MKKNIVKLQIYPNCGTVNQNWECLVCGHSFISIPPKQYLNEIIKHKKFPNFIIVK